MSCRAIDVFPLISSSFGSSGMCPAGPNGTFTETQQQELLNALNQGIPILIKRLDAKNTVVPEAVDVQAGCFTLPAHFVDVRQAFLNGCALDLRDQWYEGQVGHRVGSCWGKDLIDAGEVAIPEEWPSQHQDIRLGFLAEHDEDVGVQVQIKFRDKYGHIQEEFVEAVSDQQVVATQTAISDVLFVHKGVTNGGFQFFITYPNGARVRLMRVPANVSSPSYRRKKLPRDFGPCAGRLTILGKIRFIPLTSVTDTLPICDEAALSFLLQALNAMKNRDLIGFNDALTLSVNEIMKELADIHPPGVVTQMAIRSPVPFYRKCWN